MACEHVFKSLASSTLQVLQYSSMEMIRKELPISALLMEELGGQNGSKLSYVARMKSHRGGDTS